MSSSLLHVVGLRVAATLVLALAGLAAASTGEASRTAALRGVSTPPAGEPSDAVQEVPPAAAAKASSASSTAKALQVGDASGPQLRTILSAARHCFDAHPVDTKNLGSLQGTLGSAVGCVEKHLEKAWGWKPSINSYGSQSCGQCEGYGLGSTVIEVDTEAGQWMFVVQLEGAMKGSTALRGASMPLPGQPSDAGQVVPEAAVIASSAGSTAKALQVGDASGPQLRTILSAARHCFDAHPVDTKNLGSLQGTLGSAVGCVEKQLEKAWGWKPSINSYGSQSCGQCDGYGRGATVVEVDTEAGQWMFVVQLEGATAPGTPKPPAAQGHAVVLQQGDATDAQLAEIVRAMNRCFRRHPVDTANLGQLQATLGTAVSCVQSKCEKAWGWRPRVSGQGSHSCGRCEGYGLGATIIAFDGASSGDWMFEMRLKW